LKRAFSVLIVFAVVLSVLLTACTGTDTGTNTTTGTTKATTATTTAATTTKTTTGTAATTSKTTTAGTAATTKTTTGAATTAATVPTAGGTVMFNGTLYTLTTETVKSDEIGIQLLSVLSEVTGTPTKDGEAKGIAAGSKVYQLKNNTNNDTVAIELNGTYYKATKKA